MAQARRTGAAEIATGLLSVREAAAEELVLEAGEDPYDLALAVRVGAVDGRHPALGALVEARLAEVLAPGATRRRVGEAVVWD